jgi:hypothetical protein
MSKNNIRKIIAKPIQEQIPKYANKKFGALVRSRLESTKYGEQCLVIDSDAIQTLVQATEASIATKLSTSNREKFKSYLRTELIKMKKPVPRALRTGYWDSFMQSFSPKLVWDVNLIYTGRSFSVIRKNIKEIITNWLDKNYLGDQFDGSTWSKSINLDHGKKDSSITMMAMGSGGMSAAKRRIRDPKTFDLFEKTLKTNLNSSVAIKIKNKKQAKKIKDRLLNIVTNWDQVVNYRGQFKAGIGMVITPVSGEENSDSSKLEKLEVQILEESLVKAFQSLNINVTNIQGSSSLNQKAQKVLWDTLTGQLKKGWTKKTDLKGIKLKTNTKISNSLKISSDFKSRRVPISRTTEGKRTSNTQRSLLALQNLLNAQLSSAVEQNMVSPSLQYRTGRFADSVEVTNITTTRSGYPRIEYDYQRDPYQVFESSGAFPWNIPSDRWPSLIIDKSIRDIARQIITGRFYTTRR